MGAYYNYKGYAVNYQPRSPSSPIPATHGLWSLWDMLTLDAKNFVVLLHSLFSAEMLMRGKTGPLPPNTLTPPDPLASAAIMEQLRALDLPVSLKTAEHMLIDCNTGEKLHAGLLQLSNTVMLELDGRKFYGPIRRYEQYYEQQVLFGLDVFERFPSANNDIFEAGTCLALERGTACVMHCMRAAEVGLRALAATLEIGPQNDWGSYIRLIGEKLKEMHKASADDAFYSEASAMLDNCKRAWRNPSMHVDSDYSPERAEEILLATKSLMRHLATTISEPSAPLPLEPFA